VVETGGTCSISAVAAALYDILTFARRDLLVSWLSWCSPSCTFWSKLMACAALELAGIESICCPDSPACLLLRKTYSWYSGGVLLRSIVCRVAKFTLASCSCVRVTRATFVVGFHVLWIDSSSCFSDGDSVSPSCSEVTMERKPWYRDTPEGWIGFLISCRLWRKIGFCVWTV
jgi:hypothetical protein